MRTEDRFRIIRSGHTWWDSKATDIAKLTGMSLPTVYKARSGGPVSAVIIASVLRVTPLLRFEDLFVIVGDDEIFDAGVQFVIDADAEADIESVTQPIPHDWQAGIDANMKPEENPRDPDGEPVLIFRVPGTDDPLVAHEQDGTLHLFGNALRHKAVANVIRRRWGLDVTAVPETTSVITDVLAEKFREAADG